MSNLASEIQSGWPELTSEEPSYDYLVVVPGLKSDFSKVEGLEDALSDPNGPVSSIYRLDSVVKTWNNIRDFQGGRAVSRGSRLASSSERS